MAIAFDTAGTGNGGGGTASVNVTASAANSVAIIFVSIATNLGASINTPTVGGSTTGVTQIGSETTTKNGDRAMRTYYLYNPPTSSTAYAETVTGTGDGTIINVLIYSGANATQADSWNSSTASASPKVFSTTVVASGCWLVSYIDTVSGSLAASTGTTQRLNVGGAGFEGSGDSNGTVGTGAQTMSWTYSGNGGGQIISLAPVASGPANLKSLDGNLKANIKSFDGNLIANIKSIDGNS